MKKLVKPHQELKKRKLSSKQLKIHHFRSGRIAEKNAEEYLLKIGYKIIETNLIISGAEIDIIALDEKENEIVFVEVKTRTTAQFGHPSQGVDWKKKLKLEKAALAYLDRQRLENDFRFDIISQLPGKLEHFKNITME